MNGQEPELLASQPSERVSGVAQPLRDACGPEAIVRAAGGRVTDANGEAMDYRAPELPLVRGMVASNGLIHDEVMLVLKAEAALAAG